MTTIAGSLLTASFSAVLILSGTAGADDHGPGSGKGGKAVDQAPAGVRLTTLLPEKISVDNGSKKTDITATVKNEGTKESGRVQLLVVGFDGLTVKNVQGCSPIDEKSLPEGSNSGFSCPIDNLAAGESKSYAVDATFDLGKTGKICLPVRSGDGKKTYWQQGPVPFGTTNPSPNAPATPLLLGTDNEPVAPGGDELPKTGPGVVPLGAVAAALLAAGAGGLWWSRRRPQREG
jgi:LPXTG-motif cell wall-anchored protein